MRAPLHTAWMTSPSQAPAASSVTGADTAVYLTRPLWGLSELLHAECWEQAQGVPWEWICFCEHPPGSPPFSTGVNFLEKISHCAWSQPFGTAMRKPSLGELSKVKEMLLPGIGWHLWNASVRCRGCLVLHGVAPSDDFSSRSAFQVYVTSLVSSSKLTWGLTLELPSWSF